MSRVRPGDLWLWLGANEEQLLLHNGLVRLADHIAVPSGVTEVNDDDFGLPVMDGKNTQDLTEIILKECSSRNTTYASLMEYRLNALRGYWEAVGMNAKQQATVASVKEAVISSRSSGGGTTGFASRVSLALIFPIMKSLSRFDSTLSSEAASVLLECLRVYEPLSLSNEPLDCVYGLESLLHSWLTSAREDEAVGVTQIQNAASALVALSVAVGTGSLLVRTVHLLQSLRLVYSDLCLLVPGILCKLLHEHKTHEDTATLLADAHLACWSYEDSQAGEGGGKEDGGHRSIAYDGKFVYVTSSSLRRLLKIGTGRHGTIRGYVYSSEEVGAGWVAWVDGHLLHRAYKTAEEKENEIFCSELDPNTLKPSGNLTLSCSLPDSPRTLYFMSDGLYVYWLYSLRPQDSVTNPVTGDKMKQHPVYIHQLQMQLSSDKPSSLTLHSSRDPVLLQRGSLDRDKNSDVVKALVRANPSYARTAAISTLFGGSKDDSSGATSVGMSMRVLQSCSVYTTGTSVVFLAPPSTSGGRGLFGPSSAKALCVSVCFSLLSGASLSQSELSPSPNLHCALSKGASMSSMAACYDPHSHCVWTSNDDWIDVWECSGKVRVAIHHLAARLGKSSVSQLIPEVDNTRTTAEVSDAIRLLLRHIGIESCRLIPGSEMRSVVPHNLSLTFLQQCCDLLTSSMADRDWENCQALTITLLAVLPSFLKKGHHKEEDLAPHRERVRCLMWDLFSIDNCPESLKTETRRLISFNAESLFLDHEKCDHFIQILTEADSGQPDLVALREELLMRTAHSLQLATSLSPALLRLCPLLRGSVMRDSLEAVRQCVQLPLNQMAKNSSHIIPVFSGSLQCAAALMNVSLRILSQAAEEEVVVEGKGDRVRGGEVENTDNDKERGKPSLQDAQDMFLEFCSSFDLFKACEMTLEAVCTGLEGHLAHVEEGEGEEGEGGERWAWVHVVERALKCTVLGGLLLPLLVVIGDARVCTLQMANMLQKSLHPLVQLVAQLCGMLYGRSGKLSSIKVPAPWATGRTVETIHPVRDNYKFKETVSYPGARNLYLKFDSRCSSQYDYDKVTVHVGDSPSAPKVAEYGGNTHGFGSRSVLGKGWPKDLVKVEGDVVTFTFDMKSGREHSTPDRAMWGFACTVRPQESSEEDSNSLPFTVDVYLSLASVCCSLIGSLYEGPKATQDEEKCRHLMDSELLQRCEWHVSEGPLDSLPTDSEETTISRPPPHSPLPPVIIERLRALAKKPRPLLRPSTSELLQPDLLEDVIVSVCLKQHGLESALQLLGQSEHCQRSVSGVSRVSSGVSGVSRVSSSVSGVSSGVSHVSSDVSGVSSGLEEVEDHCSLLDAVFTRINGLERRLQVLVELEKNWWTDVDDIVCGTMRPSDAFFFGLLQHDTSLQNFELLCSLKDVDVSQGDIFTCTKQLQEYMELDVEKRRSVTSSDSLPDPTPVTRQLVAWVMERARLLLSVTIAKNHTPSLSSYASTEERNVSEDDGNSPQVLAYARSISAPPITAEYAIRRQRSGVSLSRTRQALLEISNCPDKSNLLDQIFLFIGSKPEEAVSPDCFLAAASQQWRRGVCRVRALGYLHQLLSSEHVTVLAVEHLLTSVGSVIQRGPGVTDIACGGMAQSVREAFANVMHAVVELASKQPAKCINTIAMLCIVPYTRLEEACLVRSGLVELLDRMCSQVSTMQSLEVGHEEEDREHRVTSLAWAAFQVLADRCVSWESQEGNVPSSGLAQQVAMLLTNHLSRAMDSLVLSETGASEGLQDALSLLLGLARSLMGRAILSQPACVSKLLLLLTDQRPSPKLVLIALQLCRIALPLMTAEECSQVVVPPHPSLPAPSQGAGLAADIVRLLLAKLAEYIVPDATEMSSRYSDGGKLSPMAAESHPLPALMEKEAADETGQASVYVYKRSNESSAEILQPLISQDPRQFRLSGHRMQEVMQIDRALTEDGKAEVFTDTYRSCQRRALRWANMGFVVSIGSPSGGSGEPSGSTVDKKKAKAEAAAKKKNIELLQTDPQRPFLSGQVAYSLASEVIGLLHGLVTVPRAAEVWSKAIGEALLKSLCSIPPLAPRLVSFCEQTHKHMASGTPPPSPGELLQVACIANATFATLGGFRESVRPGLKVKVVGEGLEESCGVIQSIAERRGIASVQFSDDELCFGPNKTLDVPLSRLLPPQKEMLPLKQLKVGPELCSAICAILETTPPSISHAHSNSDADNVSLGLCRLFAEMRSRACMALSHHVQQSDFLKLFETTDSWGNLRSQMSCNPGLRLSVVESHCQSLRMLYRDCARPSAPKIEKPRSEPKVFTLDVTQEWPPVTSCAFSHNLTSLVYQGATVTTLPPAVGSREGSTDVPTQPKGVMIFANMAIPGHSPSFYWELELVHIGESSSDTAQVAMGYSPAVEKPEDGKPWAYPLDAVFIRSSGRGCQVTDENMMEWTTCRVSGPLKSGDVMGCGWLRREEGNKGSVYFTLNGIRTDNGFNDVPADMTPFLHIQKTAVHVRVNFGDRPFVYGEGHSHRNAADVEKGDSAEELVALFNLLPFAQEMSDSEEEREEGEEGEKGEGGVVVELSNTGPLTKTMKTPIATVGYDAVASQMYQLSSSYDNMLECGPLVRPGGCGQEEEQSEEEGTSTPQEEDIHALLVKAWESKVFPVIQRRFRNDQERKSGLEQIRGALQLGMESIAQETVEFLYEENGGTPKDLHLPTMDDVKAELGKFTINKVHKSMAVVIQRDLPYTRCGVRSMQKTQGLTGIVLDTDEHNELVQVECYLPSEGALVRFWFPVFYLEKPPPGYRKSPTLRGADAANILVHRELLQCETSLCSIYCRRTLLSLQLPTSLTISPALDHLQLVAADCLSEPLMEGSTTTTSPDLSSSPSMCLRILDSSPLSLFYSDPSRLLQELSALLHNLSLEVEGLTAKLCKVLASSPQQFASLEVKITETKEALDVGHSDAVFLILSCVDEKGTSPPPSFTFKYPWARVLCYKGGLGKGGKQQLQEVARYPNEVTNQYSGPTYPSLILPFNTVHLKTGGCSVRPLKRLQILSLSADFPLSLAFIHSLCTHSISTSATDPTSKDTQCCSKALSASLETLVKLLTRLELPRVLKECTLNLLSEVVWTLCSVVPDGLTLPQLSSDLLQGLQKEVVQLYENEVGKFSKSKQKASYPSPGSISDGGQGKFSTYFQSLLECFFATSAYRHKFHGVDPDSSLSPSLSAGSSFSPPPHPEPATKRSSVRRFRTRRGAAKRENSENESRKREVWLGVVRNASQLLTSLTPSLSQHSSSTDRCVRLPQNHSESSLAGSLPVHPNSRLVVVTGIHGNLPVVEAQTILRRVCRSLGGLFDDQLYLPVRDVPPSSTVGERVTGNKQNSGVKELDHSLNREEEGGREGEEGGREGEETEGGTHPVAAGTTVSVQENLTPDQSQATTEPLSSSPSDQPQTSLPENTCTPTQQLVGHTVLELCYSCNVPALCDALLKTTPLQGPAKSLTATAVTDSLVCNENDTATRALEEYLRQLLVRGEVLTALAKAVLLSVFGEKREEVEQGGASEEVEQGGASVRREGEADVMAEDISRDTLLFLTGFSGGKGSGKEMADVVWREIMKEDEETSRVSVDSFLSWCSKQAVNNPARVWLGLFACGYDLHFARCGYVPGAVPALQSTVTQDQALVQQVDSLCRHVGVSSASLHPWDIFLSEASLSSRQLAPLQGVSVADLRLRFLQLKYINHQLSLLLPVIDLRSSHPLSLGARLSRLAPLLFYDVKLTFLHSVLNASTRRSLDQAPPEIKMDPLESLTGVAATPLGTQFCKAAQQMLAVPSPQLCVPLASGGDPTYAFNVKLSGEEVHGTSGSFRHFVWQVVRELQSTVIPILLPCPSGATGVNMGRYILAPGDISYSEEKLLQFFGQLLGVAIRADVPIALDLLPCFWRSLKGEPLSLDDLRDADCITFQLTQKMLSCSSVEEFEDLLTGLTHNHSQGQEVEEGVAGGGASSSYQHPQGLHFVYHTITGQEIELCPEGNQKKLTFENRGEFVSAVRQLRLRELSCDNHMTSVRCGLASIIPLQLLKLFTPLALDSRVCGLPDIDLDYLRRHTKYHVGLEETDRHVQFFWNTLESFSQEELRKFIKFACNQERIPFGHPCRDGGKDSAMNVPPYPMKIAPPDGSGPPDSRYIRAETCMFLLKLPQYSTQEIMTARLRYAIHCMEDPLSG